MFKLNTDGFKASGQELIDKLHIPEAQKLIQDNRTKLTVVSFGILTISAVGLLFLNKSSMTIKEADEVAEQAEQIAKAQQTAEATDLLMQHLSREVVLDDMQKSFILTTLGVKAHDNGASRVKKGKK